MDLLKILDMGGAIEISKNNRLSIREKGRDGMPFRISVELPDGYKSANSGYSHVDFIFPNEADLFASLMRVNSVISDNIRPPAGSP